MVLSAKLGKVRCSRLEIWKSRNPGKSQKCVSKTVYNLVQKKSIYIHVFVT